MENYPAIQNLSRWLLIHEQCDGKTGEATAQVAVCVCVCEKLRGPLSILAGVDGYRALISRALALAKAGVPSLGPVRVMEDGSLEVPDSSVEPGRGLDEIHKGGAMLVAHLLGLLVIFIGEGLTVQLVRDVWPDAPFEGIDSEMEKP